MNIQAHRAEAGDWAAIERVCGETGLAGSPVDAEERASFVAHWLQPYRELRPDWTFVAECDRRVVGYLTGAPDTLSFEKERRRVFDPMPDSRDFFPEAVRLRLWTEHPAHLIMNVLSDYRGLGVGTRMLEAYFVQLRRAGVASVHVTCGPGADLVFEKLGFAETASVTPVPGVTLRALSRLVPPEARP